MPIPQSATDAIRWFESCDTSGNWGSAKRFASCADAVIIGAHSATSPHEVKLLSNALYIAAVEETSSSSSHRVVVTPAGRNALVAMSGYATTDDSVESLAKALSYFIITPRSDAMLLTPLVRDALVALAKYAAAPMSVGYISSAIGSLALEGEALIATSSATASIRDALVKMSRFATTATTAQSLSSAMTSMMVTLSSKEASRRAPRALSKLADEFVTPTLIDAMIPMAQFASTPKAVLFFLTAFSTAMEISLCVDLTKSAGPFGDPSRRGRHGVIVNKRVCDAIISLSKFATTPEAVAYLANAFYFITTEVDSSSAIFATEAFRESFVMMAPFAASPNASCLLADALMEVVTQVPQSIDMFACVEVLRGCGYLKRYTNDCRKSRDSVDRLSNCLTTFLMRRLSDGGVAVGNEALLRLTPPMHRDVPMTSHQSTSSLRQSDQPIAPIASTQRAEQSLDDELFSQHFATLVTDLMYTASSTLPLSRAPKAAVLSSGGCRQGDACGPLAVNSNSSHPLSKHRVAPQADVRVATPTSVHLQCYLNDTTMLASSSNELYAAGSDLRKVFLIAANHRPILTSPVVHCGIRQQGRRQHQQTQQLPLLVQAPVMSLQPFMVGLATQPQQLKRKKK